MLAILLAFALVLIIVLASEHLGKKDKVSQELSRKIPHVATASAYALLALVVDLELIAIAATLLLFGTIVAYKLNWFAHARKVERKTWGEFFFPLGLIISSLLSSSKWVFIASILILGIADALAAVIGVRFGKSNSYKVMKQDKSVAGSLTFYLTSIVITATTLRMLGLSSGEYWEYILWLPLALTATENLSPYGLDNLTIPLIVIVFLNPLVL